MNITRVERWPIGATVTLLARVHSDDGGGASTGQPREGEYITAAQVDTIACNVYDRSSSTPDTSLGTPTITSAAVITAVTSGYTIRDEDLGPYNFKYALTTELIATVGHTYRVTISITLTTGTVIETFGFEAEAE